jgi:hypothetical protein
MEQTHLLRILTLDRLQNMRASFRVVDEGITLRAVDELEVPSTVLAEDRLFRCHCANRLVGESSKLMRFEEICFPQRMVMSQCRGHSGGRASL